VRRQSGVTLPPLDDLREALRQLPDAIRVEDIADRSLQMLFAQQGLAVIFVLRSGDGISGVAALGPRPGTRPYEAADLEMGAGLAAQGAVALDNGWLFRETLEKREMEKELAVAASIQQGLFPAELPALPAYDLAAMSRPAQQVGGDYYDAVQAGGPHDGRFLLCVADVSGKGLSASLLMSTVQATLRALFTRDARLAELARASNDLLFATTPGNKYATAALLLTDGQTGRCQYLGAGHTETLLVRADGAAEWLGATGVPLGLFPDMTWVERTIHLEPGDTLVLYSDGVTEAQTEAWDEFDPAGLERVVRAARHVSSSEIITRIVTAIDRFVCGAPQFDDITLLVIKRRA
jgi:phosphoserine phosphatase RsbU/P